VVALRLLTAAKYRSLKQRKLWRTILSTLPLLHAPLAAREIVSVGVGVKGVKCRRMLALAAGMACTVRHCWRHRLAAWHRAIMTILL
jgi:hypothetical protein